MIGAFKQPSPSVQLLDEVVRVGAAELVHLGITAHEHTTYQWNGYRSSNLRDAVAAVRRAA